MVSSWFRSSDVSKPLSVPDAVKVLYPSKTSHLDRHADTNARGRFSQLLLEHGEKPLQDWAVQAFSFPIKGGQSGSRSAEQSSTNNSDNQIQWAQSPNRKTQKSHLSRRKCNSTKIDKDSLPSGHMSNIEGRLHLCTGSLVFEPTETSRGIVRCPFSRMDDAPVEHPTEEGFEAMCVEFNSRRHLVMKANNTIGPYQSVSVPCRFRFTFLHSSPSSFVDLCQKLFQMAAEGKTRPAHATPELDHMINPMLDRPFDPANLVDVREQALTGNLRCNVLTPLQSKPGTMVLTVERLYFQPATGVLMATNTRSDSWLQRDVVATARRYNGLRDSALEIYWKDETSTLFAFERRHDREQVMRFLSSAAPCFTDRDFILEVVNEWQKGNISNFEYLLALNSAAGRSFHDLSRYPVFPWVIADYESAKLDLTKEATFRDLSKPVGALNKERLEYFQMRLKGMEDMEEAFLYGTHYSAPGYVLYFLVRSMPEHMLCLQNGKFDAPDRMFYSVGQCFSCAMTNHADVKELIPEFFSAGSDFDFLINAKGLQLGATQNGDRVNDVTLPPWARSARDFIKKNRKALESEICTRMLPRWIDLIFGVKSRGEGAMEANNVFHHNAYLGPTDLAGMQTEEERFQAELQATEFGIVPDMLFCSEHPLKGDAVNDDFISSDIGRASSKDESGREAWELLDAPTQDTIGPQSTTRMGSLDNPEMDSLVDVKSGELKGESTHNQQRFDSAEALPDNSSMASTPGRNIHRRGSAEGNAQGRLRDEREFPSSPANESPRSPRSPRHEDSPKIVQQALEGASASSDWDMKIVERKHIHNDAVSGCVLLPDETGSTISILVTTSLDGGLMANSVSMDAPSTETSSPAGFPSLSRFAYSGILSRTGQAAAVQSKLTEYRTHSSRDPLASLVLASDGAGGSVAFAGGHDDIVLAYGIKSACAVASLYSHRDAVTGLDLISRTPFDAECAIWLENSTHIMVSGSWDATVKVWSVSVASGETVAINREPLAELFDADSSIVCVSAKSLPTGGIVIAAGCADSSFCVWNVHSDGVQVLIHNEPARRGSACSVVKWISEGGKLHLLCAFSSGKLASYALDDDLLHRESAVSVGVPITSLIYTESVLLLGCADGCLLLIPVRDGAYFDAKPTMWKAINNPKTSPGISSISLTYTESRGETKCIACTGAEDGSVLLFELKKVRQQPSLL